MLGAGNSSNGNSTAEQKKCFQNVVDILQMQQAEMQVMMKGMTYQNQNRKAISL